MSSSGRARSMKAARLERNSRKRWTSRLSIEAGWTHFGSNGSIPMRPASIAARMSRSERTTATEYAGLRPYQRAHGVAELAPGAHAPIGVRQRRAREPPKDLDGVRAGGFAHRDVGRAVPDAIALDIRRLDIGPREPEHRIERKAGELADLLVRKRRPAVRRDHRVHGFDNEPHAVGERAVQVPENGAEVRRSLSGGDGARARR